MIILKKVSIAFQGDWALGEVEYDFDGQDYVYPLRMKITTVLKMDEAQTEDYIRNKIAVARQSRGKEQAQSDLDKVAGKDLEPDNPDDLIFDEIVDKNLEPEEVEEPEEEPEEPADPEELEVLDEELEELDEELEEIAEPEESVESEELEEPEELEELDE